MNISMSKYNKLARCSVFSVFLFISACGGSGDAKLNPAPPDPTATIYSPPPLSTIHWQLQGNINTNYDVDIYDIDLFDTSKALIEQLQGNGKKVICYFSGGSYENWRSDKGEFVEADLGKTLDGWVGERWLDIRSDNVKRIMKVRLDLAKEKGCDGVEPDNMDGYVNDTNIALTANDQLIYNRFIAEESHARGLSVGLKNDLDQINELYKIRDKWMIHFFDEFKINNNKRKDYEKKISKLIELNLRDLCRVIPDELTSIIPIASFAGENCLRANPQIPISSLANITSIPSHQINDLNLWKAIAELVFIKDLDINAQD